MGVLEGRERRKEFENMNKIDFLLHINKEFNAIPYNELSIEARSAHIKANLKMAISDGKSIATRFLESGEWWIKSARLAGIDVDKIRKEFSYDSQDK